MSEAMVLSPKMANSSTEDGGLPQLMRILKGVHLAVMFISDGGMRQKMEIWIGASSSLMWTRKG